MGSVPPSEDARKVAPALVFRLPSAAKAGQHSAEQRELRDLLHRRLKYLGTIACCVASSHLASAARLMSVTTRISVGIPVLFILVATLFLWRKPTVSLVSLRRIEILFICMAFAEMTYNCIWPMRESLAMPHPIDRGIAGIALNRLWLLFPDGSLFTRDASSVVGNPIIISWGFLAVGYSVMIPNTWRRSAVIMGLAVLVAMVCVIYVSILQPVFQHHLGRTLFYVGFAVSGFAAVGLYGTHKLSVLRSEVAAARQIGQYSLKQRLGKGGMGEVYLAQHRMLRRPCAIKLIRPDQVGDASSLARFEREVQTMAGLTHANTVEIYDYGRTEEGTFFYAMEFLPGMSLEDLVRSCGLLPPGRAIHFLRQVCSALGEAHGQGFIHRDIKPANIFVCDRGGIHDVIKLLDFGLVRDANLAEAAQVPGQTALPAEIGSGSNPRLTQVGYLLGTPAYMSPEQIRGEEVDARSDIYNLGGVLTYLLTGRLLFERTTLAELCAAHLSDSVPLLRERNPEIPVDLEAVAFRCLAKSRDERFHSVQELDAALAACAAGSSWTHEQAKLFWSQREKQGREAALAEDAFAATEAGAP